MGSRTGSREADRSRRSLCREGRNGLAWPGTPLAPGWTGSRVACSGWGAAKASQLGSPREACRDRSTQPVSFARSNVDALLFSMPVEPRVCGPSGLDCDIRIDRSPCCCRSSRLGLRCSPSGSATHSYQSQRSDGHPHREGLGPAGSSKEVSALEQHPAAVRLPRVIRFAFAFLARLPIQGLPLQGLPLQGKARVAITPTGGSRRRGGRSSLLREIRG